MGTTYKFITSNTLGSNSSSVVFSNISTSYSHLILKISARSTHSTTDITNTARFRVDLNGSSSSVGSVTYVAGSGTAASSARSSATNYALYQGTDTTASTFANTELFIPLYLNREDKPFSALSVTQNNATTTSYIAAIANLCRDKDVVSSITLTPLFGQFATNSSFFLYGVSRVGAASVPNAPTIGTATAGGEEASVTFTPSVSGDAADSYIVTSSPGSITSRGILSPIRVTGLTGGTAYTFTVNAINDVGTSATSDATSSITPSTKAVYFAGGVAGGSNSAAIDKLPFGTETRSTLSATLSVAKYSMASFANSGIAGYGFSGDTGDGSTDVVATEKLNYSTDAASSFGASGTVMARNAAGMANSGTAGYAGGGGSANTNDGKNIIQKLLFSNETRSLLAATMRNGNNYGPMGYANSGTAGYFIGGYAGSTYYGNYQKITFSDDSSSNLATTLTTNTGDAGAFANSGTAGYVLGGATPTRTNVIVKMPFSTETSASIAATLAVATTRTRGAANSGVAGYVGGGFTSANYIDTIQKLAFSTDTRTSLSATLGSAKDNVGAHANSGTL